MMSAVRKLNYFSALIFLIIAILSTQAFSLPVENADTWSYSIPERLIIPDYEAYLNNNSEYNPKKFYPIGWSKNGRFAYIIFSDWDDGLGDYISFNLIIQDMKSDKILYQYDYIVEPHEFIGGLPFIFDEDFEKNFEQAWLINEYFIIETLREYEITQREFELSEFPFTYLNDTISIELKNIDGWDGAYFYGLESYKVIASSDTYGSKVISSVDDRVVLDVELLGFFKSPYENRIAVIILESERGFEGPPIIINPAIIGCHLITGFKQ